MQLQLPILECLKAFPEQQDDIQSRIEQIIESDENKRRALDQVAHGHDKMKTAFHKHTQTRTFKPGDIVLLWDKRREQSGMNKKWDNLWIGPFKIIHTAGLNSYHLETKEGESVPIPINGQLLKEYFPEGT